jgi:uncharacterized protein (UPF0305 family)
MINLENIKMQNLYNEYNDLKISFVMQEDKNKFLENKTDDLINNIKILRKENFELHKIQDILANTNVYDNTISVTNQSKHYVSTNDTYIETCPILKKTDKTMTISDEYKTCECEIF